MLKIGCEAIDPLGRAVTVLEVKGDLARVRLAGPYGATMWYPCSCLTRDPQIPDPTFPKRCTKCAKLHTAAEWRALEYVGIQDIDETEALELRNCQCGSTISVHVETLPYALP